MKMENKKDALSVTLSKHFMLLTCEIQFDLNLLQEFLFSTIIWFLLTVHILTSGLSKAHFRY